jgi:hypothetical protein
MFAILNESTTFRNQIMRVLFIILHCSAVLLYYMQQDAKPENKICLQLSGSCNVYS